MSELDKFKGAIEHIPHNKVEVRIVCGGPKGKKLTEFLVAIALDVRCYEPGIREVMAAEIGKQFGDVITRMWPRIGEKAVAELEKLKEKGEV